MDPTEARRAGAGVAVHAVCAVGSILARIALTLIDIFFTLWSPESRQAGTQEAINLILTNASIAAGVCGEKCSTQKSSGSTLLQHN